LNDLVRPKPRARRQPELGAGAARLPRHGGCECDAQPVGGHAFAVHGDLERRTLHEAGMPVRELQHL